MTLTVLRLFRRVRLLVGRGRRNARELGRPCALWLLVRSPADVPDIAESTIAVAIPRRFLLGGSSSAMEMISRSVSDA